MYRGPAKDLRSPASLLAKDLQIVILSIAKDLFVHQDNPSLRSGIAVFVPAI